MSDLIDHFVGVGDYGVELLKCLQTFIVVAKTFVYKSKVVNSFNAISFDSNSFKEELLRSVVVLINEEAVTLVDEGLRVISIMLNGQV